MRVMQLTEYGPNARFSASEWPDPQPGPGQVRLRVVSSSLNPLELKIRFGQVAAGPELPALLNADVAGYVDQLGEGVTAFQPGDAVIGCAGGLKGTQGALADFMLADARLLSLAPRQLPLTEAGTLPLATLTAWSGLIERAALQSGERVLVHGATGGVGHFAVQIAKACGAEVHARVSTPAKAEIARQLGADQVSLYTEESIEEAVTRLTQGQGYDLVFDSVGGDCLAQSMAAAAVGARVVSINTRSTQDLSLMHSKGLSLHVVFRALPLLTGQGRDQEAAQLAQIVQLVDAGLIRPWIAEKPFGFHQINEAHDYLASGQAIGKVLLTHEGI